LREGWSTRDEDLLLMPSGTGKGFVRLSTKAAKEFGVVVFSSGKEAEEITVSHGAKFFRAVAEVWQAVEGKDIWFLQAVQSLQALKRGNGDAKATVQMAQGFKQLGFYLRVRIRAAARGLRQRIGAYRFSLN
jgi:hypothetical protein